MSDSSMDRWIFKRIISCRSGVHRYGRGTRRLDKMGYSGI